MKVDRVHLIVHPGFAAESDDQALRQGHTPTGSGEVMKQRYIEGLRQAGRNDIALAFLHVNPLTLPTLERGSQYAQLIQDIQDVMGDRLLIHSNGRLGLKEVSDDLAEALRTARQRGFDITSRSSTIAYGETLQCCVSTFAEHANISGAFETKTVVDIQRCDVNMVGGIDVKSLRRELPSLRRNFPHLDYRV